MTSVQPVSDAALASITDAAQRYLDHTRPSSGEDLWALNITSWMGERMPYVLARLTQAPAAPKVAYRAMWNTITLGLYSNPDAARAHCIGAAVDNDETGTPEWLCIEGEEDDDLAEVQLFLTTDDGTPHGSRSQTEYSVLPLDLLDAYDPEAEG